MGPTLLVVNAGSSSAKVKLLDACAGKTPTLETLAARAILSRQVPDPRIRVVSGVSLLAITPLREHGEGLAGRDVDDILTRDKPIIFAFNGDPWLIRRLTCRRADLRDLLCREEGTASTLLDAAVLDDLGRFRPVLDRIGPGNAGSVPGRC